MSDNSNVTPSADAQYVFTALKKRIPWYGLLLMLGLATPIEADPDLWGHLRFGLDMCRELTFPIVADRYSYLTLGSLWINHEWLSEVVMALSYLAGGPTGLAAGKTLAALLVLLALWKVRRSPDAGDASALAAIVFLAPALLLGLKSARPQLATLLGVTILVSVLRAAERGSLRKLWALPPLFLLWVNLHGGVLAGAALLGIWVFFRFGESLIRMWRDWEPPGPDAPFIAGIAALCGLALLVNPYGVGLPAFLLREGWGPRPEIAEWQPIRWDDLTHWQYLWYPLLLLLTHQALCASDPTWTPALRGILVATAFAPLLAARHLPLFAVTWLILGLGPWVRHVKAGRTFPTFQRWVIELVQRSCQLSPTLTRLYPTLADAGLLALGLGLVLSWTPLDYPVTGREAYPSWAVRWIQDSRVTGKLLVHFDWGEYALYHLGPQVTVSIDGRRETVYPRMTYREHLAFYRGKPEWRDILSAGGVEADLALLRTEDAGTRLLETDTQWELVRADDVASLLVRRDSPAHAQLSATTPPDVTGDNSGGGGREHRVLFP